METPGRQDKRLQNPDQSPQITRTAKQAINQLIAQAIINSNNDGIKTIDGKLFLIGHPFYASGTIIINREENTAVRFGILPDGRLGLLEPYTQWKTSPNKIKFGDNVSDEALFDAIQVIDDFQDLITEVNPKDFNFYLTYSVDENSEICNPQSAAYDVVETISINPATGKIFQNFSYQNKKRQRWMLNIDRDVRDINPYQITITDGEKEYNVKFIQKIKNKILGGWDSSLDDQKFKPLLKTGLMAYCMQYINNKNSKFGFIRNALGF